MISNNKNWEGKKKMKTLVTKIIITNNVINVTEIDELKQLILSNEDVTDLAIRQTPIDEVRGKNSVRMSFYCMDIAKIPSIKQAITAHCKKWGEYAR